MPLYMMLSRLTHDGRKTIRKFPERIWGVDDELEKMGVKVLDQYALLGRYDFLSILEAPDNETIAKASVEFGSRGTVEITTLALLTIDELVRKMKELVESVPEGPKEHTQLDG